MDTEIWKEIYGYPMYLISSHGRVKSLHFGKERIRSTSTNKKTGYVTVVLCTGNKAEKRYYLVHRLVAIAFIGNPPTKRHEVNHKDKIRNHNYSSNLEWKTRPQNIHYSADAHTRGERQWRSKLKERDIPKIRALLDEGVSLTEIGRRFGVGIFAIWAIKKGINWWHVGRGKITPEMAEEHAVEVAKLKTGLNRKLRADQIPEIRRRIANGDSNATIASDYGVSNTVIYWIRVRRQWQWA